MSFPQDITAERSRLMQGGKRGPIAVSEDLIEEDTSITYVTVGNGVGNPETITHTIRRADGTAWIKTTTFTYDSSNKLISSTESLVLQS